MPNAPFLAPDRDYAARDARFAPSGGSVLYQIPGVAVVATGTVAPAGVNTDVYAPFIVASVIGVDQLAAEITSGAASGNFRMGIYPADFNWQPVGAPLADSGSISTTSTGVKTYTPGTPVLLRRGRYLSVLNLDSTGGGTNFRYVRGGLSGLDSAGGTGILPNQFTVTRTYAAFPTPGTAWDTLSVPTTVGVTHLVWYRLVAP